MLKILLIDDDEDDYIIIREIFDELRHQPLHLDWVNSYEEGRARLLAENYDVYLLDYRLGERTGLCLIEEAIAAGILAPIVLLTGLNERDIDIQAMKAGAVDYLVKGELNASNLERCIRYAHRHGESLRELRRSRLLIQASLDALSTHIVILDQKGMIVAMNAAWDRPGTNHPIPRLPLQQGVDYFDILASLSQDVVSGAMQVGEGIRRVLEQREETFLLEYFVSSAQKQLWYLVHATRFTSEGENYVVVAHSEITERKELEQRLRHEAFHDSLTLLPNRAGFIEELKRSFRRFKQNPGQTMALAFLDLDLFKNINDTLGHQAGDIFLKEIASRLESTLRGGDFVARLGGDEFTILLRRLHHPDDVVWIAKRLQKNISKPFSIEGNLCTTSLSIGFAFFDESYAGHEELMRDADIAMYQAKRLGRGSHVIFRRKV